MAWLMRRWRVRLKRAASFVFWTMAVVGWILILYRAWPPGGGS